MIGDKEPSCKPVLAGVPASSLSYIVNYNLPVVAYLATILFGHFFHVSFLELESGSLFVHPLNLLVALTLALGLKNHKWEVLVHFYYSLGTLGTFKNTSWAHLEHLEHWSHFKNWAEADTLPLPSSGRYPLLLHLGNNRHISRCLSSSWTCCARWGGHCGRRCTCQCHRWFG